MARSSSESSSDKAEESASSSKRATGSNRGAKAAGAKAGATERSSSGSSAIGDADKVDLSNPSSESTTSKRSTGGGTTSAERREAAKRVADEGSTKTAAEKREAEKAAKANAALSKTPGKRDDAEKGRGFFGTIALFLRQVMAELRKVVTPTRSELFRYTGVVLIFVIIMMIFVSILDLLFGWGASWVFGTGTEVQWPDFSGLFGGTPDQTTPAP